MQEVFKLVIFNKDLIKQITKCNNGKTNDNLKLIALLKDNQENMIRELYSKSYISGTKAKYIDIIIRYSSEKMFRYLMADYVNNKISKEGLNELLRKARDCENEEVVKVLQKKVNSTNKKHNILGILSALF